MTDICSQLRRQLVTHSTLNIATGETTVGSQEWETRPCGIPLFSDDERKRGTCRSCAEGWTHEHNYPIAAEGSQ